MLDDVWFQRTQRLARDLAGIELSENNRDFLARRCARFERGGGNVDTLLAECEQGKPAAIDRLINLITTRHTAFFRDPWQFQIAAEHVLWIAKQRRAQVWSAACASGEEPYSMAMAAIEIFKTNTPPVDILATDIAAVALATAEAGIYAEGRLEDLSAERRAAFLIADPESKSFAIAPALRALVRFARCNLLESPWPVVGPLDVVFCRNVLMYLDADKRLEILTRIAHILAPNGLLFLDVTEYLGTAAHLFAARGGGIFMIK